MPVTSGLHIHACTPSGITTGLRRVARRWKKQNGSLTYLLGDCSAFCSGWQCVEKKGCLVVMFLKRLIAIPVTCALLSTLKPGMPPREGGGTQPCPLPSMGCRPSWSPSQSGANSSVVAAALLGGHGAPGLQTL